MKTTRLVASFGLALILLLTMVAPTMAKPVDNGWAEVSNPQWITDTSGNHWFIDCVDYYNPATNDFIALICWNPGWTSVLVSISGANSSYEYDFSINMKKGTATLANPYVNLTATASGDDSDYSRTGLRREGEWTVYYYGPGSLKGTITVGSTVYTFNYTSTSDFLWLLDYHHITK